MYDLARGGDNTAQMKSIQHGCSTKVSRSENIYLSLLLRSGNRADSAVCMDDMVTQVRSRIPP